MFIQFSVILEAFYNYLRYSRFEKMKEILVMNWQLSSFLRFAVLYFQYNSLLAAKINIFLKFGMNSLELISNN